MGMRERQWLVRGKHLTDRLLQKKDGNLRKPSDARPPRGAPVCPVFHRPILCPHVSSFSRNSSLLLTTLDTGNVPMVDRSMKVFRKADPPRVNDR